MACLWSGATGARGEPSCWMGGSFTGGPSDPELLLWPVLPGGHNARCKQRSVHVSPSHPQAHTHPSPRPPYLESSNPAPSSQALGQPPGIHVLTLLILRNLHAGQEATVRTGHETTDWFQIGKGVHQGCMLSPCLITYMQGTTFEMLGWMKHKLESRLPGEISITSGMQMTLPFWQKAKNYRASL